MRKHKIEVFDSTLQKTYEWINDLMDILGWEDRQQAYIVLKGTLQALRDRLPMELAIKFGAQLPMLIRGFYYEGWKPVITPIKVKGVEDFLDFVTIHIGKVSFIQKMDIEAAVRAVFTVIAAHIAEGEVGHLKQSLPAAFITLWPTEKALSH